MKNDICQNCGIEFTHNQVNRKYCSPTCFAKSQAGKTKSPSGDGNIDAHGYRIIRINGHRIREHRYVMELHLGRKLLDSEVVHHKDHNKLNNSPSNLELLASQTDHTQLHRTRFSSETHKECCRCGQIKPRSEFSKGSRSSHTTDPHQGYCRPCAAEKAAERKKLKTGTCPRCGKIDVYLPTKGMCGGCNATLWYLANRERYEQGRRDRRAKKDDSQ